MRKGNIKLIRLDEVEFYKTLKKYSKLNEKIDNVTAFQNRNEIFIKNDRSLDKAFGEIVHEGQHALDEAAGLFENSSILRQKTKEILHDKISMESYVNKMTDKQVIELRARIAEREFQITAKQPLDFNSVAAMITEIFELY